MALKVYMSKAYDRLEWDFIEVGLLKFGFCIEWVSRIMKCITLVKYNLRIEGRKIEKVNPSRGLR